MPAQTLSLARLSTAKILNESSSNPNVKEIHVNRSEKAALIAQIKAKADAASFVVVTDFKGNDGGRADAAPCETL